MRETGSAFGAETVGCTTARPAATTDVPAAGCVRSTIAPGRVVCALAGADTLGDGSGVVQRRMIAGTWRWCVGDTLFGAEEGIPCPVSKARSQIWNDETSPAKTRAVQTTHESQLRIGGNHRRWVGRRPRRGLRNVRKVRQSAFRSPTLTRFFPSLLARYSARSAAVISSSAACVCG